MFKNVISIALGILWTVSAFAKEGVTVQEMMDTLHQASQKDGVQVGLLIDPHTASGSKPYAEVVTLQKSTPTAFDALQAANVTKVYHPQYKQPPNVMIYSLMGFGPDKVSEGKRTWAFFVAEGLKSVRWVLSDKGVAQTPVKDGTLLGFSRTTWVRQGNGYKVHAQPRLHVK